MRSKNIQKKIPKTLLGLTSGFRPVIKTNRLLTPVAVPKDTIQVWLAEPSCTAEQSESILRQICTIVSGRIITNLVDP